MSAPQTDTPRTATASKTIGVLAARWKYGEIDALEFSELAQNELNKLGTLERELSEAKKERDALRGIAEKLCVHSEHNTTCGINKNAWMHGPLVCDCGLKELLSELDTLKGNK